MNRSLATYARIHWPSEYKDYLAEKAWTYYAWKGKRLRQLIKADILSDGSEYKFEDWLEGEYEYHKNYQWNGDWYCVESW